MLPEPAMQLLRVAFPGAALGPPAATFGGYSHHSAALSIDGRPCVVKAADSPLRRDDLRREAAALAALGGRLPAAPPLLALAEGPGWTALVCARLPGAPGLRLYDGPRAALAPLYRALGATLAELHRIGPAGPIAGPLDLAARLDELAVALGGLPLPPELREPLGAALAHPAWRPPAPRLTHGDAGLHNLLWDDGRLSLVDWELAGWGSPLRDLAWLAWTMRFRGLPAELWAAFVAGYRPPAGLAADGAALAALARGQIAGLLWRARGGPAWEEWLRRARWSLALDFSAEAQALASGR